MLEVNNVHVHIDPIPKIVTVTGHKEKCYTFQTWFSVNFAFASYPNLKTLSTYPSMTREKCFSSSNKKSCVRILWVVLVKKPGHKYYNIEPLYNYLGTAINNA